MAPESNAATGGQKMSDAPFIPPKTAAKIAAPALPGTRHKAALEIAIPLIGQGFSPNAVYQQLRDKFPADVTDTELQNVVRFAVDKNPQPCTPQATPIAFRSLKQQTAAPVIKQKTPIEHASWWLNGAKLSLDQFVAKSQIKIPEKPSDALIATLELLYNGPENLNIVCAHLDADGKARPNGAGKTQTRDAWVTFIRSDGVPQSKAGAWFRPNPTKPVGTGSGGAITDSDVESFRFLLLESDVIPIDVQLALFAKLKLPLSAVLLSGGASAHAWCNIGAKTVDEFTHKVRRILTALEPFGIDQSNKNPSRLSRLPGAVRQIGASNGGLQKLLWLNPGRKEITDQDLDRFEKSLLIPAIEEKPFAVLCDEAMTRYEDMMVNRGKLGVPIGLESFDKVSGGLKPGGYTLLAAGTGVGKTTLAINMINSALRAGYKVALFSLEMPREDIVDMMFSMNCSVNRNVFNTGEFTEGQIASMIGNISWMRDLPLWIDDKPDLTVEEIRQRVFALRQEANIGLAVVDYAQLALPDGRVDTREQAVASVALGLRLLSREANIPIVLLSQLNDDGKVRESRKLTHEAATVMYLTRDSEDLENPNMTLKIMKGRKIPSTPIRLYLKAEYCRITERSPIEPQDQP